MTMTKKSDADLFARHDENGVGVPYLIDETMGYMNPTGADEWPIYVFANVADGGLGHGVARRDGDGYLCRMNDGGNDIAVRHCEYEGIFVAVEFRADQ